MKVPLADLRSQYLAIKPEIDSAIQSILDSSQFILGKAVSAFEEGFAAAHHAKHCIGVGSGTDSLHAALWATDIKEGDAVITTPFTFIATVEAISLTGARPLLVDIDPATYTMNPSALERLLSSKKSDNLSGVKIRAIVPVHLYGQAAQMDAIGDIAKRHGLAIIEDACQSHLATYGGKFVGNFGVAACFSFYPGKNLGAYGEAGAVITDYDALATKIRQLRDHGQVEKYKHAFWGHNYRMDGIQGAVLGVKLKYLEKWTTRRRQIAGFYKKMLEGIGDIILPFESPKARHVYHLFVIRTKKRSGLQKFLAEKEIGTALHYPIPLHFQEAYKHLGYRPGDFPVSESAAEECISLPLYPEMTDDQAEYVAASVKSFFRK